MGSTRKAQKPPPGIVFIEDYEENGEVQILGIASRLGITPSTYRKWRMAGKGPQTFDLGKRVAARIDAIDAWIAGLEKAAQQRVEHAMRAAEPRRPRIRAAA
ncbi:helix-turn-helix transcriptional regulator [Streptomyces sp. NPDC087525]|uniref:helix-turn-helix transcriptional regulator n=1 Tax=Streptomyces sp. NPDC087525 TaxID=3365793 RepID=UPI003815E63D